MATTLATPPQTVAPTVGQTNPETASVVIFGASGDLTARKLLPALFDLSKDGYLADRAPIIGVARREKTDEVFRNEIYEAINGHVRDGAVSAETWERFARRLFYRQLDIASADGYPAFREQLEETERQQGTGGNRVLYMATSPALLIQSLRLGGQFSPHENRSCRGGFVFKEFAQPAIKKSVRKVMLIQRILETRRSCSEYFMERGIKWSYGPVDQKR